MVVPDSRPGLASVTAPSPSGPQSGIIESQAARLARALSDWHPDIGTVSTERDPTLYALANVGPFEEDEAVTSVQSLPEEIARALCDPRREVAVESAPPTPRVIVPQRLGLLRPPAPDEGFGGEAFDDTEPELAAAASTPAPPPRSPSPLPGASPSVAPMRSRMPALLDIGWTRPVSALEWALTERPLAVFVLTFVVFLAMSAGATWVLLDD
jgi:hypothetical protein